MTNPKNNFVHECSVDGAPICIFDLSDCPDKLTVEEYNALILQFNTQNQITSREQFGVITSEGTNFLEHEKFKRLIALFNTYQEFFSKEIVGIDNQFTMVHSWMTKNTNSSKHHNHVHLNAMISVLYYFNESLDNYLMANIFFRHKALRNVFPNHFFKFNNTSIDTKYNNDELDIPIRNHTLLVFPGSLEHGTRESKNTTTRYCLGTNYFITGKIGCEDTYTKLNIEIKHG